MASTPHSRFLCRIDFPHNMIRQCCERDGGWLLASRRISTMSNRGASRHDQTPPRASSCSADKHESQGRRSPHRSIDHPLRQSPGMPPALRPPLPGAAFPNPCNAHNARQAKSALSSHDNLRVRAPDCSPEPYASSGAPFLPLAAVGRGGKCVTAPQLGREGGGSREGPGPASAWDLWPGPPPFPPSPCHAPAHADSALSVGANSKATSWPVSFLYTPEKDSTLYSRLARSVGSRMTLSSLEPSTR